MTNITDLLNEVGIENLRYQVLSMSATNVTQTEDNGAVEITFITESSHNPVTTNKDAIVIWAVRDQITQAFARLLS